MELAANKIFRTVAANPANYDDGNYEIYGELRVEKVPESGVFEKTLEAFLTPDDDDNAVFQLQDGAADFFPLSDFNPASVTDIELINDNQVRAQFYSAESFGEPPVLQSLVLSDTFRILKGGRPKIFSGNFFTQLQTAQKFLTWHPGNKKVDINQPEILHFYVYPDITAVTQKLKVYYSDNTDTTVDVETSVSVLEDRIYRMPAGYTNLNINAIDPEKKVVKYETWITDQSSNIVAGPFTYVLEEITSSSTRYWMFVNSLGMWEIMRTEGIAQDNFNVSRQNSQVYLTQEYPRWKGEIASDVTGSENVLEVSSGFFDSKQEALWATDLMMTDRLLLLESSQRVPYVVSSNSAVRYQDKNYNYFLRFQARLAYNDVKYGRI
jgi:hypothetical protein